MGFLHHLQKRWAVKSVFQVVMILLVFSCTGFSVLYVEEWILSLLGIPKEIPDWLRVLLFVIITLPVYQILLLFYGFLFGQFRFFYEFEKRFFKRIFGRRKNNSD
jgi:hypothetical protein